MAQSWHSTSVSFVAGGNPKSVGLRGHGLCLRSSFMPAGHAMPHPCRISRLQAVRGKGGRRGLSARGYNKLAGKNWIIVLYPQTTASTENPEGCFDW
jgi:hypothetical protein